ncbi:MAG TPA: DUF4240 domain-containing protein [Pirellulales bacterium]
MASAMNRFWKLIDKSRLDVDEGDVESQLERLQDLLEEWEPEEIVGFHRCFTEAVRNAYRWDLWGAAYLINDGCDEAGFDDFLGWLIAQGRDYYLAALDDPQKAGDRIEEEYEHECEAMWSVAAKAYEARTGRRDFYVIAPDVSLTPQGQEWAVRDLAYLFPRLARRFGRRDR